MKISGFLLLCSVLLFSCDNNAPEKSSPAKPAGQQLFESYCISCHGADGKLGLLGAKDLSVSSFTLEQIVEIIQNGKGTMTPFNNVMNPEEISAVAVYVESLKQ